MAMPLPSPCIMITSLSGCSSSSASRERSGVEVVRPGGEVLGEPGELGAADRDAGAGLDDLLGLPEPARGQVEGRQGPHPQRVRVARQDQPGVSRVQVRLAPVPVGLPGDPDRPEHAGHAPAVAFLHDAVPDPGGARDPRGPLLAGGVDVERGLQQPPLQLAALGPDHLLPLPVIEVPRLLRGPGRQPANCSAGAASAAASSPSSGTSLPSSRTCLIVTENLTVTAAPPDACRE